MTGQRISYDLWAEQQKGGGKPNVGKGGKDTTRKGGKK